MAKGAVGLIAGYWPEDVHRYLAVPGLSLDDGLVARPARRRASHPAIVAGSDTVEYARLARDVDTSARAIRTALGDTAERVSLVLSSPYDLLVSLLGAARVRAVPLLLDAGAPPEELRVRLDAATPDVVVADAAMEPDLAAMAAGRWKTMTLAALHDAAGPEPRDRRRLDLKAPAVGLMGPGDAVLHHSHASLMAWAVSWSSYLSLTEEHVVLAVGTLDTWPALTVTLGSLFRGGACVIVPPRSRADLLRQLDDHRPRYVMMPFADALEHAASTDDSLRRVLGRSVEAVFLSLETRFDVRQRRRIESAFDVPVLTVVGGAATGPVLAAHPTWYVDEAAGLPITNVDLWPLSPLTSRPLAVPWEAIDHGEIGVRSPLLAVDRLVRGERLPLAGPDEWFPLGAIGLMDPAGLFYLYPWR